MRLGIIISVWGALPHFQSFIRRNWDCFQSSASEIIFSTDTATAQTIESNVRKMLRGSRRTNTPLYVTQCEGTPYKTKLQNLGALATDCEMLFFCDADMVVPGTTLRKMIDHVQNNGIAFLKEVVRDRNSGLSMTRVQSAVGSFRDLVEITVRTGAKVVVEKSAVYPNRKSSGGPGIVCVNRALFYDIAGYDEDLTQYGWEDIDLLIRAGIALGDSPSGIGYGYDIGRRPSREKRELRLISESRNFQHSLANYCLGNNRGSLDRTTVVHRRLISARDAV